MTVDNPEAARVATLHDFVLKALTEMVLPTGCQVTRTSERVPWERCGTQLWISSSWRIHWLYPAPENPTHVSVDLELNAHSGPRFGQFYLETTASVIPFWIPSRYLIWRFQPHFGMVDLRPEYTRTVETEEVQVKSQATFLRRTWDTAMAQANMIHARLPTDD